MELFECHGHIFMDGEDFHRACARHRNGVDTAYVRTVLEAMQKAGITWYREGGDPYGVSLCAREMAGEYGITVSTPVFAIHKAGHYGSIVGREYETMDDYRRLLDEIRRQKGDFVKLMLSGVLTFQRPGELSETGLPEDEIYTLISLAHEAGFSVMAHANGDEAVCAAVKAGADSVEHGCFLSEDTVRMMASSRTVWVPTLTALDAFIGREGFSPTAAGRALKSQQLSVRYFSALGGTVACGSDAGAVGVHHGVGIRREVELLHVAGVTDEKIGQGNREIRRRFGETGKP